MEYWLSIIDKLGYIIMLYLAIFLLSVPIQWRKTKLPYFFLVFAAIVGLCFALEETRNFTAGFSFVSIVVKNITEVILFAAVSASMLLIKKYSLANFLFVCVASYATIYMAENLNDLFFSLLFGPRGAFNGTSLEIEYTVRIFIYLAIHFCTFIVLWFVFIKRFGRSMAFVANKSVLVVFALTFFANLFIGDLSDLPGSSFLFVTKILSSVLALFVLYNQSEYLNSREENTRLQLILEQQKLQYENSKDIIEKINIKAHDLKHFVEIFKSINDIPQEALSELNNLSAAYDNLYHTGNKALDVTLTEKCATFVKDKIEFSILAEGSVLNFLSDVDIYVMFGNIIENAKEAVLREDENNRIIGMYVRKTDNFVSLHIENVCTAENKPQFYDGLPLTVKEDKLNHGFGTKSIKHIVDKYGGTMQMYHEGGMFQVDIVFYVE